ncbi:uncharacterized protein LOC126900016 [Daktulosphaira vitifoliae]|uniref:uncharacterized protein LOC126900016 n=1 Tax=Daktulosphaira vitifoliae TaxID=58002 RepID=UPI0021AA41D6|nr:uncharacterized protein LOC126900016 [Daktulosphaira vitifoliae]
MPQHYLTLGLFFYTFLFICEIRPVCKASCASKQDEEFSFWLNNCPEPQWHADHPLPIPKWGISKPVFTVYSLEEYEELVKKIQMELQLLLKSKKYDSVTNFIRFYNYYKSETDQSFEQFFRGYEPKLNKEANNCVGLSLLLIGKLAQLDEFFPEISKCLYIVSCDRFLNNVNKCTTDKPNPWITFKDHILIALQIEIIGRKGVLILDPGFLNNKVITVMDDKLSPHTGYFPAPKDPEEKIILEMVSGRKYVEYLSYFEGKIHEHNLIYIEAPYLSPISVTERSSLVSNYRNLVTLNENGQLLASFYVDINEAIFSFSYYNYNSPEVKHEIKVSYETFISNEEISENVEQYLRRLSKYFNLRKKEFITILRTLSNILKDEQFLKYREITNNNINNIPYRN